MILKKRRKNNYVRKILPIIPKECTRCGDWFVLEGIKMFTNYTNNPIHYYCESCSKDEILCEVKKKESTMEWSVSTPRELMDKICNMVMGWENGSKREEDI